MKELAIDLWRYECDVRCITTNGTVTPSGINPMGGGCAGEAARAFPSLPKWHGVYISTFGVNVYIAPVGRLLMFPTKWAIEERASIGLIVRSAHQLVNLADAYGWKKIALPRPGSGLGGLNWRDVRPALVDLLDDRFRIIRYPGEAL